MHDWLWFRWNYQVSILSATPKLILDNPLNFLLLSPAKYGNWSTCFACLEFPTRRHPTLLLAKRRMAPFFSVYEITQQGRSLVDFILYHGPIRQTATGLGWISPQQAKSSPSIQLLNAHNAPACVFGYPLSDVLAGLPCAVKLIRRHNHAHGPKNTSRFSWWRPRKLPHRCRRVLELSTFAIRNNYLSDSDT